MCPQHGFTQGERQRREASGGKNVLEEKQIFYAEKVKSTFQSWNNALLSIFREKGKLGIKRKSDLDHNSLLDEAKTRSQGNHMNIYTMYDAEYCWFYIDWSILKNE